jgi:hypothetical protein
MVKWLITTAVLIIGVATSAHAQQWQLVTPEVHVTKTLVPEGTMLDLIHKNGDRVTIRVDPAAHSIRVSRNQGRTILATADNMGAIAKLLQSSNAVKELRKLARQRDADESDEGEVLRLQDLVVGFLTNDQDVVRRHREHFQKHHGSGNNGPALVAARFGDRRSLRLVRQPDNCWDDYLRSAIRIADEFVGCKRDLAWYDVLGAWSCDAIYVTRCEGAWAWYWACNGGVTRSRSGEERP